MALALPMSGGGERVPIIKYDARAGRIFRVDRAQNAAGQYDSQAVEITPVFQAVMDLENIEQGWLSFPNNAAPDIQVVRYPLPLPPKPSAAHRPGFRIMMLLGKASGGDVREMAANAGASIRGMDDLHNAYLAGVKANPGKLPIVKLAGTTAHVSTGKQASSTNYEPVWQIAGWTDRPALLSDAAIQALRNGQEAPQAAPAGGVVNHATNGATPPAPPPPPPATPPPPDMLDDFAT